MDSSDSGALPRILLLEDDAVSAAFLAAAIEALPAQVTVAGSLAQARGLTSAHVYDLWLFDANLPDGLGAELLAELRACGQCTAALAHTADHRPEALDALIDAGFDDVLLKPLSVGRLQSAIRNFCSGTAMDGQLQAPTPPVPDSGGHPLWDDDAALRALNGQRAHVDTMRGLFARELPQVSVRVAAALAQRDTVVLHGELHKLQASCGFVGAARLTSALAALRDAPESFAAAAQFEDALQDTLASLSG